MEPDLIIAIAGIISAAIFAVFCSFGLWHLDKKYQERKVANGFYLEIKESEVRIIEMTKTLNNNANWPPRDIIPIKVGIPGTFSQADDTNSQTTGFIYAPSESFYPQYGIFLETKKEISRFHKELAESLYTYYTNLFEAENDRLFLNTVRTSDKRLLNNPEIMAKYEDMKSRINYCSIEIPQLKNLLEERINQKIFLFF